MKSVPALKNSKGSRLQYSNLNSADFPLFTAP